MNNSAAHTALKNEILIAHGARPDVRLFNNPVGFGWMGEPMKGSPQGTVTLRYARPVTFGLCPGSADVVGIKRVVVTEAMVGSVIGQWVTPEVKTGAGRASRDQSQWLRSMVEFGALAGVVRSPEDLGALLDGRGLFGVAA